MAKSRFKITEFINPSGAKAFRVSGTLNGQPIRKEFKTRAAANNYRQTLDIEFLNRESCLVMAGVLRRNAAFIHHERLSPVTTAASSLDSAQASPERRQGL